MRGIATSADVFETGKLPQTEAEWLDLTDVYEAYVDVNGSVTNYAVFGSEQIQKTNEITIYTGGIPRDSKRREKLPLVNKLFGYVASGLAMRSTIGINFNWPGQGRSEGNILSTSINSRSAFLSEFSKKLADEFEVEKVNFVGASMGAYCAVLAGQQIDTLRLGKFAFLSPAAYPASAHNLTYRDGFSLEINKPWNVCKSPVYKTLADLHVPTLIAYSEFDDPPIPRTVQEAFKSLSETVPEIDLYTIANVCHNFRRPGSDQSGNIVDNEAVRTFGRKVVSFIEHA
jgi:dienelactone hydrolase